MRKKKENQTSGEERFAWKKELKRKKESQTDATGPVSFQSDITDLFLLGLI